MSITIGRSMRGMGKNSFWNIFRRGRPLVIRSGVSARTFRILSSQWRRV